MDLPWNGIKTTFLIATWLLLNWKVYGTDAAAQSGCPYKFRASVKDSSQGWLRVDLHNPTSQTVTYEHFLACPSLKIIKQGVETVNVPAGNTQKVSFLLEISKTFLRKHPEKTEHSCTFSKWTKGAKNEIARCKINIVAEPKGLFSKPCDKHEDKDVVLTTYLSKDNNLLVSITHHGKSPSAYASNISCVPDINLIHHGNIYNTLKDGEKWEIPIFPNCSRVLDIDYSGICHISVYHLCQEHTLVVDHGFPYYEGDTHQCTYIDTSTTPFVQLFYNTESKVPVLVSISISMVIGLSSLLKMGMFMSKHGSHYGWNLFLKEIQSVFWFCCCCWGNNQKKEDEYKLMT